MTTNRRNPITSTFNFAPIASTPASPRWRAPLPPPRLDLAAPTRAASEHAITLRQAARLTESTSKLLGALAVMAEAPDFSNAERLALARRHLMRLHELLGPTADALAIVERALPKGGAK
jgi:hypothetical protein